ncbi:unnamed protein product, partial [Ectocarpus fasciculatus]
MSSTEERRTSARQRRVRPTAHSSALESLRAARDGLESRTEQHEDDDDEVYDEVTEEEYQELVRKRQQADDFVVDDDGLGYADDGEEFIEKADGSEGAAGGRGDKGGGRKGVNGKINADSLRRKARKLNQLGDEASQAGGGIKKFLRTGGGSTVGPSALSRNSSAAPGARRGGGAGAGGALNLDDMLSDLTSNPIADLAPGNGNSSSGGPSSSSSSAMPLSKRKRGLVTPQSARSRRSYGSTASRGSSSAGSASRRPPVPSAWTVRDYEDDPGASGDGDNDIVGDDVGGFEHFDGEEDANDAGDVAMEDASDSGTAGAAAAAAANDAGDAAGAAAAAGGEEKELAAVVSPEAPATAAAPVAVAAAAKPRSRFARMKETNNIAVTAAAEAALRPKIVEEKPAAAATAAAAAGKGGEGKGSYMPSLEFQGPQYSLSEAPSTPAGSVASASSWLQKDETGEFMRMFWLDATEQNGTIYLIGKVAVPSSSSGSASPQGDSGATMGTTFLSACVAVHSIEREVLVLPRLVEKDGQDSDGDEDGGGGGAKRADIGAVYQEMASVLVPRVIKRNAKGEQFRRPVMRKYAFGDLSVPREETQYLKIKYPAGYPALPEDVCESGGKTFQAIFGARTPLIESFLIKRKLMGPCWITVRNPKVNNAPVSWCKVEVAAQSPKSITRLLAEDVASPSPAAPAATPGGAASPPSASKPAANTSAGKLPPPPPVVTMSLSMKTVVSPRTHTHEVVALSALVHREVRLDGASDESGKKMGAWLGIRPLGQSAGEEYPKVFPHDIKHQVKAAEANARRAGRGSGVPIQTMPNERALLSLFFHKLQQEDPDVLVAHNLMGFDFDILLSRAVHLKLATWSKAQHAAQGLLLLSRHEGRRRQLQRQRGGGAVALRHVLERQGVPQGDHLQV